MKNLTMPVKVSLGFGLILTITLILGVLASLNMNSAKETSLQLSNEYVPEAQIAVELQTHLQQLAFELRGYNAYYRSSYLDAGKKELAQIRKALDKAEVLGKTYPSLVKLIALIKESYTALDRYESLVKEMESSVTSINEARKELDRTAGVLIRNTADFLASQNEAAEKEYAARASVEKMNERLLKITKINDIIDMINAARISNFKAQASRDRAMLSETLNKLDQVDELVKEISKYTRLRANIDQLNAIMKAKAEYKTAMNSVLQSWITLSEINNKRRDVTKTLLDAGNQITEAGMGNTVKLSSNSAEALDSAATMTIAGLIIAMVLGISIAVYLVRSITRPIIAAVSAITDANTQVVAASDQIASSSTSLAEGASEQASSIEEVSATIEESASINNQNSENSREADILAKDANQAAQNGYNKIEQLMSSMQQISSSSDRISKIIKTIDEIAFQTNLLALNAAVEAARAGEHGLGFAVVAEEVKNLAERSAGAAKEIAGIIEESIEQVKDGNAIARDSNEAFNEILEKIKKTSELIGEIAISSNEQSEGMRQITSAIGQIDQVTQQNAAASEEAAAAAEELNAQALAMLESVAEIGQMVGYDAAIVPARGSKTTARKAQTKSLPHTTQAKPAKRQESRNNEIFPLDDDDLKEF